jgi:NADH:ubiquinone oxidoreductase subunit 4 (subunit M)
MAFFGPFNEKWDKLKDMSRLEQAAGVILIAFLLFMGLWPAPFIDRISSTVLHLVAVT